MLELAAHVGGRGTESSYRSDIKGFLSLNFDSSDRLRDVGHIILIERE